MTRDPTEIHGRLEGVIDSDRYVLLSGGTLGEGIWGKVYYAYDTLLDKYVAVKVLDPSEFAQSLMADRNLTEFEALRKEAVALDACANIVPRTFEVDKNGKPFLVMPKYSGRNLAEIIGDGCYHEHRSFLGHGMDMPEITGYLADISNGLSEMHTILRRVHGDLMAKNIVIDDRDHAIVKDGLEKRVKALITDLGTATVGSFGKSESPRDNMGFPYIRPPECFEDGSHPTYRSDVWAFGSLTYRLLTGEYFLQAEIDNTKDPIKYVKSLGNKVYDAMLKQKLKKVPKNFRGFMKTCLACNPENRYANGAEMKKGLQPIIEELTTYRKVMRGLRVSTPVLLVLAAVGFIGYKAATLRPEEITLPKIKGHGLVISGEDRELLKEAGIIFENEKGLRLPKVKKPEYKGKLPEPVRMATKNKYVAKLMLAYEYAAEDFGWHAHGKGYNTPAQWDMWRAVVPSTQRTGPHYPHLVYQEVAASITLGLMKSRTPDGKVDLEDVCAIARVGPDAVNRARRASGSFDFEKYSKAKDSDGNYIIPPIEWGFIRTWIAYSLAMD